jgi:glycosyltransferase involved in cell wall biosynthesis
MKICVISPGVVHAVPRTVAIADQFDEVHFVDIVGNADRDALQLHGIVYHGPEGAGKLIKSRQLGKLIKKIQPEVIICHYASGDHVFRATAHGLCPVAVIAMGNDVLYDEGDSYVSAFKRLLTRMALRRSLCISAKSEFLAKRIKSYGVKSPVDVNYWGADLARYYPGERVEARRKLRLDNNKTIILSPRAIEPRLNIHMIVEAFVSVLIKHPNALLIILGRPNPDYKNKIEEIIKRLNVASSVCVLDEVSQDVLPQYYQASDVVVSMGHSEGFPNTLLEVMACKVPIVVGRIAQVEELLEHDKNAWICEKEPRAIAEAILNVLDDQNKSQRISNAAYTTAREYADIKMNGVKFSNNLKRYCITYKRRPWMEIILFRMLYGVYCIQRKIITVSQVEYV